MTREELDAVLASHAKWVVDLHGADLRGVDLRGANLRKADLSGADLREADLREADLRGVNGFVQLTQTDHGHSVFASWSGAEWMICAGYWHFTISEARNHWGSSDYALPQSGSRIVALLDWLEKQPTPEVK